MNRALASGPIVWLGIIVTTCLLLVLFQTMLWLVLPVLLAVVAYYLLSPLVNIAVARGITRARAVLIVTVLLTVFLVASGLIVYPKVSHAAHNWPAKVGDYAQSAVQLVANAQTTLEKMMPFMHRPAAQPEAGQEKNGATNVPKNTTPAADEAKENDAAAEALDEKVAAFSDKYSGDIAMDVLRWIPSLLLVPYITYFFLRDECVL
jgi:predicted PurR-regulated permease PerM